MTRHLKVALATLLLLTAGLTAASPADARQTPRAWNYKACNTHPNGLLQGGDSVVCLKAIIRRQADGRGTVVIQFHPYANTTYSSHQATEACGSAYENGTAVRNDLAAVVAVGRHHRAWSAYHYDPDLTDANNCSVIYQDRVKVGAARTEIHFSYLARLDNYPDARGELTVYVGAKGWGCDADTCSRART